MCCNGTPKISRIETETETGKVVTVLKDTVPILRIYATNGVDGKNGEQGIQGVAGMNGINGLDGQDCTFPDTLWLKWLAYENEAYQYAVSNLPLPPEKPNPDTSYVKDVILENGEWVYILRGDSLQVNWTHGYRDINNRPIDPEDLFFHVAYENRSGEVFSLKPFENVTQDTFLVMYGLPSGMDIIPAVAAFKLNSNGDRLYSSWAKSTDYGWKARRE